MHTLALVTNTLVDNYYMHVQFILVNLYVIPSSSRYKDYELIKEGSHFMSMFPFYHAGGMLLCTGAIYQRAMSIVISKFDFEKFLQLIEKYRVSI